MKRNQLSYLLFVLVVGLALSAQALAQETDKGVKSDAPQKSQVTTGQKQKIKGVIVKREADSFVLRDQSGTDTIVTLTNTTKVEEKKGNPFRRARNYGTTQLLRGLNV